MAPSKQKPLPLLVTITSNRTTNGNITEKKTSHLKRDSEKGQGERILSGDFEYDSADDFENPMPRRITNHQQEDDDEDEEIDIIGSSVDFLN